MRFRPCIDIHNGRVKQIVGGSLRDAGDSSVDNFVSGYDASYYADMYYRMNLPGGHVILLNPAGSPYYEENLSQARMALNAHRGFMQVGGGINQQNAESFLDAGASHVIVTSAVFRDGHIDMEALKNMVSAVGKEHLVLDLSCKKKSGKYMVVTDRWQKITETELCGETLDMLAEYCDEFLIHAADVEGRQEGISEEVAGIMGGWGKKPVTYAGGVHDLSDLDKLKETGNNKVDVTVGSALDIFGGSMRLSDVVEKCRE